MKCRDMIISLGLTLLLPPLLGSSAMAAATKAAASQLPTTVSMATAFVYFPLLLSHFQAHTWETLKYSDERLKSVYSVS